MLEFQTFEPAGRLRQVMALVEDCNADLIGQAIDALIAKLDERDGDPDLEDDDLAAIVMKAPGVDYDTATDYAAPDGLPGDPIDAEDSHDQEQDPADAADVAYPEWHTRGRHKLYAEAEMPVGLLGYLPDEDAEDDDPRESTAVEGKQWWDHSTMRSDDDEADDEDCCPAGDDEVRAGMGPLNPGHFIHLDHVTIGSEDDAEDDRPPCYSMDQRKPLFVRAANDWPVLA